MNPDFVFSDHSPEVVSVYLLDHIGKDLRVSAYGVKPTLWTFDKHTMKREEMMDWIRGVIHTVVFVPLVQWCKDMYQRAPTDIEQHYHFQTMVLLQGLEQKMSTVHYLDMLLRNMKRQLLQ